MKFLAYRSPCVLKLMIPIKSKKFSSYLLPADLSDRLLSNPTPSFPGEQGNAGEVRWSAHLAQDAGRGGVCWVYQYDRDSERVHSPLS